MPDTITAENAIFGHTDEATAYVVNDYPYGYTARTQIRYWIETTKNGDRFVSQTLNPKTGAWNKPKRSTYAEVGVMFLNDVGHVKWCGVHLHEQDEFIAHFIAITEGKLSEIQRKRLARVIGLNRTFKDVTFSIREGAPTPEDDARQAEINRAINRRAAVESNRAFGEIS